ncbi:MAG: carbohydrate ABC transporter permease [Christensenellaceae bacterium]|nr:carbohydrate ABC transporter permease [Christensenellaceae bacterium]MDD6926921.1 carbohydrate ABC transporter permease [bacterium]MDY2850643.1 carbohydrate ABC transporter permease [Christensenellaceae bacterium]
MNAKKIKESRSDRIFYIVNYIILGLLALIVIYPLYFITIASFSSADAVLGGKVILFPVDINFDGYVKIFQRDDIWRGYLNTIFYTVAYTALSVLFTVTAAWALSRKKLPFRKFWMAFFIVTMFFGGGLIPFYNVVSGLGMLNSPLAIILPGTVSAWNLFMAKTFFQADIPDGIVEAAEIDGAGKLKLFVSVILPLSMPIVVVLALYYAVGQWNSYFNAMIFLSDEKKYPLQLVLKEILTASETTTGGSGETILEQFRLANQLKYVSVIVSSLPMFLLYPFAQKFFAQGVTMGSLKG